MRHTSAPLLGSIASNRRLAGLRLFFDPDDSCPERYCPSDEADWEASCRHKSGERKSGTSVRKRNHWKPVVVPNRTRDVDVHQFTPMEPYVRKQVWRVCFQHRPLRNSSGAVQPANPPPKVTASAHPHATVAVDLRRVLV